MTPSPITSNQAVKILKALAYSFTSGFVGGFVLSLTAALSSLTNGGSVSVSRSFVVGLIVAGVVGGINTLAVTVKQIFTQGESEAKY